MELPYLFNYLADRITSFLALGFVALIGFTRTTLAESRTTTGTIGGSSLRLSIGFSGITTAGGSLLTLPLGSGMTGGSSLTLPLGDTATLVFLSGDSAIFVLCFTGKLLE